MKQQTVNLRGLMTEEAAQGGSEYALIAVILVAVAYAALALFREGLAVSFRKTAGIRGGLGGMYP